MGEWEGEIPGELPARQPLSKDHSLKGEYKLQLLSYYDTMHKKGVLVEVFLFVCGCVHPDFIN